MKDFLIYLFEANVALLFFGIFYYFVLRKDTHLYFRRLYILGFTVFSLILPLLHFNLLIDPDNKATVKSIQTFMLPEIVITAGNVTENAIMSEQGTIGLVSFLYIAGTALLAIWFLFQVAQVLWFFLNAKTRVERHKDHILIYTNGTLPTFSFFRLLFLDNSIPLSNEEKQCVLDHELAHIRQLHSLDIVLLEGVKILFWMNPVCWYFRNEIQDLHEYLADEKIIRKTNTEDYSSLLAKMALNKAHLSIGHHFNKSKTLKRIQMMKTTKTTFKRWKFAALVPVLGLIMLVFSCNDEAMEDMQDVVETSTMTTNLPPDVQLKMDELVKQYPDAKFNYIESDIKNEEKVQELKQHDPNTIAWVNVNKDDDGGGTIGMIVRVNGTFKQVGEMTKDGEVFLVVEDPAMPIGGYTEFYNYIAQNLKYPAQARSLGVEGKVFIQMIIAEDGSITEVTPVKGIGAGCDGEAVRVISNAPAWQPAMQRGKAVKQKIIIPIVFALGNGNGIPATDLEPTSVDDQSMNIDWMEENGYVVGTITRDDGKPLPGVNVIVGGTSTGSVSNVDGSFKVPSTVGNELVFSFIGYQTEKVSIK